uniref:ORF42b n=1 Tax=Pinus thunbergii TaxID=3350 RepID=Q32949_PINTH|nr:ORF42b [Pinus thunbergii]
MRRITKQSWRRFLFSLIPFSYFIIRRTNWVSDLVLFVNSFVI